MNGKRCVVIFSVGLLMAITSTVFAGTSQGSDLQSEMKALKARIAELEARQDDTWLNERRAEEVKGLVRDVLSDADTRASLLEDGMTAGHNGQHFFLASHDGGFLLNVGGQFQVRWVGNFRDRGAAVPGFGTDEVETGFELRRVKLFFNGHVGSPRITYAVGLQTGASSETVTLDHAYVGYEWMDGVTVYAGQDKAPFLREETTSSKRQLAVERSLANEFFTAGRVQGVWAAIDASDNVKLAVAITDGIGSGESGDPGLTVPPTFAFLNASGDATDIAVTGRADILLAGEWGQMKDFSAWSGEEMAVFVGGAFHYESAETGDGQASSPLIDSIFAWTLDGSIENEGWNLFASLSGTSITGAGAVPDVDLLGFVVQSGYMVVPDTFEPFVRWEWIDPDISHQVNLVSVGANYYLNRHNAKFTADVVWAMNSLDVIGGSSGLGLLPDVGSETDQFALRAQFQLLF